MTKRTQKRTEPGVPVIGEPRTAPQPTTRVRAIKMMAPPPYEAPSTGSHLATITAIDDAGTQLTKYGTKLQVRVRCEIEERDSRGLRKTISQFFTNSLHEKSGFRKFFEQIGHPLPIDGDVETDSLLGINFRLTVERIVADGKPRVRIVSVEPLQTGGAR